LLKNAYYKPSPPTPLPLGEGRREERELETLPNIDINIKCGNSLINRFALDADLRTALSKSNCDIETYRNAVQTYRNAETKKQKREMERLIDNIKSNFRTTLFGTDSKKVKLRQLEGELYNTENQILLFEETKAEKKAREKKITKLNNEIDKLKAEIEDVESGRIYDNAFEWRFEFPEVLNDGGDFLGFDVVIGNPPYVFARENFNESVKKYFADNYKTSQYQVNLFLLFIEKTISILKNKGKFTLIVPNSMLMVSSAKNLRKHLLSETSLNEIINLMGYSFEGVNVETIIISSKKERLTEASKVKILLNNNREFIPIHSKNQSNFMQNEGFELNVFSDKQSDDIIQKLTFDSEILNDLVLIKAGLKAYESGKGNPKQTPDEVKKRIYDYDHKFDDNTHKYLEGKDVNRYLIKWSGTYLKYGENLAAPRSFNLFNSKKIIIREITGKYPQSIIATYTEEIYLFNMSNIAILEKENLEISLKYILGILNSKLMSYYFIKNTAKSVRQMFPKLILEDLRKFPIKKIGAIEQQCLISIVDQILTAKKSNPNSDTTALEKEIDQLVYELYGLTEEEIKIVESKL
jgi:tRNA1(Val) A37 N6-methylase TrmN6